MTIKSLIHCARLFYWRLTRPRTGPTIEMRQQQLRFTKAKLASVSTSADTAEILAGRIKAILAEQADILSGFPHGALFRRGMKALSAHVDILTAHPGQGLSPRQALQEFARSLAANSFTKKRTD